MTVSTEATLSSQNANTLIPTSTASFMGAAPPVRRNSSKKRGTWLLADNPGLNSPTWSVPSRRSMAHVTVSGLSKWEGKIVEIEAEIFTAELYPIDSNGMPITADFQLELLGSDASSAEVGDVFYLIVRTVNEFGKRPTHTESLRLRRLGRVTPGEVRAVYAKADALMERLEQLFD